MEKCEAAFVSSTETLWGLTFYTGRLYLQAIVLPREGCGFGFGITGSDSSHCHSSLGFFISMDIFIHLLTHLFMQKHLWFYSLMSQEAGTPVLLLRRATGVRSQGYPVQSPKHPQRSCPKHFQSNKLYLPLTYDSFTLNYEYLSSFKRPCQETQLALILVLDFGFARCLPYPWLEFSGLGSSRLV